MTFGVFLHCHLGKEAFEQEVLILDLKTSALPSVFSH